MKNVRVSRVGGRYAKGIMSSGVFTPEQLRYLSEELRKIVAVFANHDEAIEGMLNQDQVDGITNAVMTVDYAHHEIHSGSHYFYDDTHSLAKNTGVAHLIITPDSAKWCHLVYLNLAWSWDLIPML